MLRGCTLTLHLNTSNLASLTALSVQVNLTVQVGTNLTMVWARAVTVGGAGPVLVVGAV